ncbi:hypothetical protein CC86DRAFT_100359 [Ophiobolus disseminans]|uniref:Uncharacterized protein n=1 Tax=Ophiobolus disseminans TaxID=1469910 RepID=A0A6A6ZLE3_9PLEO|nr:hypothetical protein CC86DRAFT_100359 [Ophiobolus disseminans]
MAKTDGLGYKAPGCAASHICFQVLSLATSLITVLLFSLKSLDCRVVPDDTRPPSPLGLTQVPGRTRRSAIAFREKAVAAGPIASAFLILRLSVPEGPSFRAR